MTTVSTVADFVSVTHPRGKRDKMPNRSIGLKDALSLAQAVDWQRMALIADEARQHLPGVLAELESLKTAHSVNPARTAQRAILFGIFTPNRDEQLSIAWALHAEKCINWMAPGALAKHSYPTAGNPRASTGMYTALQTTLAYLQRVGPKTSWTLSELEALPGVGPKVARMIQAVLDPTAVNWTVDLWHQRQIIWAAGQNPAVRCTVGNPGYKVLEAVWLEYAERFFPGVPTFAVQWATWCAADGKFCSHSALWEDLAAVA